MNKTKPPTRHLIIFFLLLGGAIFIFYFTQYQISRVSQIKTEINFLMESQGRLSDLGSQLPMYSNIQQTLLSTLPKNEKEIALYAANLERIAKENNLILSLSLDDFQSPVDVSGRYLSGIGVEMTLEGSYLKLSKFLSEVSKLKNYTKIYKITLVKLDGKPGVKALINGSLMVSLAI